MKREDFLARLNKLELTQKEFLVIIGFGYQIVNQWKDGVIPNRMSLVLDYLDVLKVAKQYGLK